MKWGITDYGVYCPSCAEMYGIGDTPEPDFEIPGQDHCSNCGAEYFNSPPGILKRFKKANDTSVTGTEMDDVRVGAIRLLKNWYEIYPGLTDTFMEALQEILEA